MTAQAMLSLTNHNGFHDLIGLWEKHHASLLLKIETMEDWSPMKLGQWQGKMTFLKGLLNMAKDTKARIAKLDEELRYAEKSANIPRIVRPDVTPPRYGAT